MPKEYYVSTKFITMAKFVNGINGPFVGKIGNVVGSSRNGEPYLKAKPARKRKRNRKPKTENQSRFSMAHYWLQPLLNFVKIGFKDFKRSGEFNAAKSHLLLHSFEGTNPDFIINPALVKLSSGDLPIPADLAVAKVDTNKLEFTWTYDRNDKGHSADQVMMVAYDVESGIARYNTTGQFRRTGSDTLTVTKGKTYHVYAAFTSHDRLKQSESVYMGEVKM